MQCLYKQHGAAEKQDQRQTCGWNKLIQTAGHPRTKRNNHSNGDYNAKSLCSGEWWCCFYMQIVSSCVKKYERNSSLRAKFKSCKLSCLYTSGESLWEVFRSFGETWMEPLGPGFYKCNKKCFESNSHLFILLVKGQGQCHLPASIQLFCGRYLRNILGKMSCRKCLDSRQTDWILVVSRAPLQCKA